MHCDGAWNDSTLVYRLRPVLGVLTKRLVATLGQRLRYRRSLSSWTWVTLWAPRFPGSSRMFTKYPSQGRKYGNIYAYRVFVEERTFQKGGGGACEKRYRVVSTSDPVWIYVHTYNIINVFKVILRCTHKVWFASYSVHITSKRNGHQCREKPIVAWKRCQ